ncbi:hypothetical protein MANES_05G012904v8 [Manihot esculenta]|uniref:Uncharacterized protein n=1 Tax=Manihot esculenta TaxID=3983 RepID=A0ACB7HMV3_MANES|nr:hypothetical protein MANES_05G012904v8 [Manihot esculenta]
MLVTGGNSRLLDDFKLRMQSKFEMLDLGIMSYFFGLKIEQGADSIFVSQRKNALKMLKKFNLDYYKSVVVSLVVNEKLSKDDGAEPADASLYRSLVGSLIYLTASRPDLMYSVSLLSRFMHSSSQLHFVLRYLKGTAEFGLALQAMFFFLGSGPFSWNSRKQEMPLQILVQHGRTRLKFYFLREVENNSEIKLLHCKSNEQLADILIKVLSKNKFAELRKKFGISRKNSKEECRLMRLLLDT